MRYTARILIFFCWKFELFLFFVFVFCFFFNLNNELRCGHENEVRAGNGKLKISFARPNNTSKPQMSHLESLTTVSLQNVTKCRPTTHCLRHTTYNLVNLLTWTLKKNLNYWELRSQEPLNQYLACLYPLKCIFYAESKITQWQFHNLCRIYFEI